MGTTQPHCICSSVDEPFLGLSVSEIPELMDLLVEEKTNFCEWITEYTCPICGQHWLEKYESHGQSDIPSVIKVGIA